MEENSLNKYLNQDQKEIIISEQSIVHLKETAKWSKFIAIIGFVSLGLLILLALFFGVLMSFLPLSDEALPIPGFAYSMIYMIMALIYFFPINYLYKFSKHLREAIDNQNSNSTLDTALKYLKMHYKYIGIMMVILIMVYLLIFIGAFIIGLLFGGM